MENAPGNEDADEVNATDADTAIEILLASARASVPPVSTFEMPWETGFAGMVLSR